jgi:glycerol-3-phosphate dehydrogenase
MQALANELAPAFDPDRIEAARADLYQERWTGQRHALWGDQLAQAMLTYALHATTFNRDGDPVAGVGDGSEGLGEVTRPEDADESAATGDGRFGAFDTGEPGRASESPRRVDGGEPRGD